MTSLGSLEELEREAFGEDDNKKRSSEAVNAPAFQDALKSCISSACKKPKLPSLPWESGTLSAIFGDPEQVFPSFGLEQEAVLPTSEAQSSSDVPGEVIQKFISKQAKQVPSTIAECIRSRPDRSFHETNELSKKNAIQTWVAIVDPHLAHFQVGRDYISACMKAGAMDPAILCTLIDDTMGTKSPPTIQKRGLAMRRFCAWCKERHCSPFPLEEQIVWEFVTFLTSSKAATSAASFLQSVRFAAFTVGCDDAFRVIESARILGRIDKALASKRATKRAPPFTVGMVLSFHDVLHDEGLPVLDRLTAGTILFAIYGRCRWSDLRHIDCLFLDEGHRECFLEAMTKEHKTARKQKQALLPIVAPSVGVSDKPWAKHFVELRDKSIDNLPGPLLPAPRDANFSSYSSRGVSTEEASKSIQALLRQKGFEPDEFTSHSAKETVLSLSLIHI